MNLPIETPSAASPDWRKVIVDGTTKLVFHQTWRKFDKEEVVNEGEVREELENIKKEYFDKKKTDLMQPFDWMSNDKKYWVFGYRAGTGSRKVSIICHLDTVPPGNLDWKPFEAREETRIYNGAPTPFLIGRGAIDDKGPAVVAFEAFTRALNGVRANPEALERVTLEVLFDTSEETDMSTPYYFRDHPEEKPELGIVFDAYWSVRAEKGVERPVFTVGADAVPAPDPTTDLVIVSLKTPEGLPVNMIPVTAEAHIQGPAEKLKSFAKNVKGWYLACPFDDSDYHPADIQVTPSNGEVVITALVAGAQHGSAPHQNRANGANPVVSLTNFLAFLVDRGILANNYNGEMSRFIRWAFGTRVFGENHPDLLSRFDSVFQEGNGTTYALTQLGKKLIRDEKNEPKEERIQLGVDVRYAVGHHSQNWDGSEGQIAGGFDLRLMSVDTADGLVNEGRNLVIVALVGTNLHIRIFDANGNRVVDKAESELMSGETLITLKKQLNPLPDESGLSPEQKRKIIRDATAIAGYTLAGKSLFESVFNQLVRRYQSEAGGAKVTFTTKTIFGPDIRSLRNDRLFRVNMAYRSVMGENCPMHATGGGTDAHGVPELVVAGALFTTDMGPPINYHGLDEGAPLTDLENSGKILLYLLQQELAAPVEQLGMHRYEGGHAHACIR